MESVNIKEDTFAIVRIGGLEENKPEFPIIIKKQIGSIFTSGNDKQTMNHVAKLFRSTLTETEKSCGFNYIVIELTDCKRKKIEKLKNI